MERSLLGAIQETAQQYAEVISNVIHVDVEIVDQNLTRIAGTGDYEYLVDVQENGGIYRDVLLNGKQNIIENPREHPLCVQCPKRETCNETLEICSPIIFENNIIGVIGLICTTENQKDYILKQEKQHLQFLNKMSELISAKIFEHKGMEKAKWLQELLFQVLNSVEDGVLVTETGGNIVLLNSTAMKILNLNPSFIGKPAVLSGTNEFIMYGETVKLKIDEKNFTVVGKMIYVDSIIKGYEHILIFKKLGDVRSTIIDLTGDKRVITIDSLIGSSPAMRKVKEKIRKISGTKSTVFITGESGTGKELIARSIHWESPRRNQPFVGINCAAIPDTLLESELFGYVRGAFSGASPNGRIGKFELANKGILFLDEIGDMPLYLQAKLLRVLQERTLSRIGSNEVIQLDIRVIAATNKDLRALVKENKFREDLYYRINVIPLEIPPLRQRPEDIKDILYFLIEKYNRIFDKYVYKVTDEALNLILRYPWPGNVRELENAVEFMINLSDVKGIIDCDLLPQAVLKYYSEKGQNEKYPLFYNEDITLRQLESDYIKKVLEKYPAGTNGKKQAAKHLGIGIATLYRKIQDLDIQSH